MIVGRGAKANGFLIWKTVTVYGFIKAVAVCTVKLVVFHGHDQTCRVSDCCLAAIFQSISWGEQVNFQ